MKKFGSWDMKRCTMYGALCLCCFLSGLIAPHIVNKYKDTLFTSLTAQAKPTEEKTIKKQTTETKTSAKQASAKISKQAIENKLKALKNNIVCDTPEDRKYIEFLLDQVVTVPTGQKRIMRIANDIKLQKVDSGQIPGDALYLSDNNTCYISDMHKRDDLKLDKSDFCHPTKILSHEFLHKHQKDEGLTDYKKSSNPYRDYSMMKICEVHAFVEDTVYEVDWYKKHPDHKLTLNAKFYMSEFERFKKQGQSDEAAECSAKTNLTRVLWSNCTDIPQGCNIEKGFKTGINAWNQQYDIQTFTNTFKIQTKPSSEKEEEKRTSAIFAKYIEMMGINLSPDYFCKTQKNCSIIQPNSFTSIQSNHSKNYDIIKQDDHFIVCEFAQKTDGKSTPFILNLTSYNSGNLKDGPALYRTKDGKIKAIQINKDEAAFATCVCDKNENINQMVVDFCGTNIFSVFKGGKYPAVIAMNGTKFFCDEKNGLPKAVQHNGEQKLSQLDENEKQYIKGVSDIIQEIKNMAENYKQTYGSYNPRTGEIKPTQKSRD